MKTGERKMRMEDEKEGESEKRCKKTEDEKNVNYVFVTVNSKGASNLIIM